MEKDLKTLLTNPLKDIDVTNDKLVVVEVEVHKEFKKIAKELFNNYGIKCGNKIFRFAEIEFYYYKKKDWQEIWNIATYYRNKNAGELFFHYSGVDICFQSDSRNEFGGILIRSLVEVDKDDKFVALHKGPMICANLMLNSCKNEMPSIWEKVKALNYSEILSDFRFGVDKDSQKYEKNKNLQLSFFINQYEDTKLNWQEASKILGWNKQKGELKESNRYYNRFKK